MIITILFSKEVFIRLFADTKNSGSPECGVRYF